MPDAHLFQALRDGTASVVTDEIDTFTTDGIRLRSGEELPADLVVTATGLQMVALGKIELTVDGDRVDPHDTFVYKGQDAERRTEPRLVHRLHEQLLDAPLRPDLAVRPQAPQPPGRHRHDHLRPEINPAEYDGRGGLWSTCPRATSAARPASSPTKAPPAPGASARTNPRDLVTLGYGRLTEGTMQFKACSKTGGRDPVALYGWPMETAEARYAHLRDRLLSLYREGKQREALELLGSVDPDLAPWSAELAHFEACMYGSIGNPDSALAVLQRASAAGAWWHESLLFKDDDLAALRNRPEFERLVDASREHKVNDVASWTIDRPEAGRPVSGVVVALHGTGQRATRAAKDWAPVVELGYALVCVDSSQLISPKFRTWLERDLVVRDITAALAGLPDELTELPMIAAGFSSGGRAALEWALSAEPTAVAGVILLAPSLGDLPAAAAGPLSPATILVGTRDHTLHGVDQAADQLTGFGFDIVRIPGLGHNPPEDFGNRLNAILAGPNDRT